MTDGVTTDSSGRRINQAKKCYTATGKVPKLVHKFKTKVRGDHADEQIKQITRDICSTLETPEDELYLFGSGHGSYLVRAVAGLMHHMGLPKRESMGRFDDLFDATCALQKARAEDDNRNGPRLLDSIQPHTLPCPRIRFVGLLDSVKRTSTMMNYDIGFVPSIQNLRMALGLNENRSNRIPELFKIARALGMTEHSFIQAWFIGSTDDMAGGTQHDGLSLYPLQWMVIESLKTGLTISYEARSSPTTENSLSLMFPQYAGNLPKLDGSEEIQWSFKYTNGIQVSMFDLQVTHTAPTKHQSGSHGLKLDNECFSRSASRKVFGSESLKGWNPTGICCPPLA